MTNWGEALRGAVVGGASAVGMLADDEIKRQNEVILNNNRLDMERRKAALEEEIKIRAEDRARARLAKYTQGEVDVTTPAAATVVDDEGNSNAPNDIHTKRSKTLAEIRDALFGGGEFAAGNLVDQTVDRTADRESREKIAKIAADTRIKTNEASNETKLAIQFDKDGTPKATGPGAAQFNRGAMAIQHKIDRRESAVDKMREQLFKLDENLALSEVARENRKKSIKTEMDDTRKTLTSLYTEQDNFIAGIGGPKVGMIDAPVPGSAAKGTKATPLPMPVKDASNPAQYVKGNWYNTSRGVAMWNGTGFEN